MVDGPFFSNLLESIRLHQTNASYCSIERNAMEHLLLSLLDCVSNQRDKAAMLLLYVWRIERLSRKTPLQKPLFSWSWWFLIQQYLPATSTTIRKTSELKLCHYFLAELPHRFFMLYQITLTREHRTKPTQMENDILSRFREASSLCGIFYYEGYVVKICQ